MRYIRTEEGFIIDTQNTQPFQIANYMGNKYIDFNSLGRFKIKATSDAIEELCDKFVWIDDDDLKGFIGNIEFAKNCTKSSDGRLYGNSKAIFGAIWTEWGLKYVAKMNDKGEFELLEQRREDDLFLIKSIYI